MSARISKPILGLVILSLIISAASLTEAFLAMQQLNDDNTKLNAINSQYGSLSTEVTNLAIKPSNGIRTVYMTVEADWGGSGYDKFLPGTVVVLKGDTVKIILNNTDTMDHGFAIDAYSISQTVSGGSTGTVQFVANQAGVFTFYCTIPCGDGHSQMTGQLIVLG